MSASPMQIASGLCRAQNSSAFACEPIVTKRTAILLRPNSWSTSRNCASGSAKNRQPTCRSHTTSAGSGIGSARTPAGAVSPVRGAMSSIGTWVPAGGDRSYSAGGASEIDAAELGLLERAPGVLLPGRVRDDAAFHEVAPHHVLEPCQHGEMLRVQPGGERGGALPFVRQQRQETVVPARAAGLAGRLRIAHVARSIAAAASPRDVPTAPWPGGSAAAASGRVRVLQQTYRDELAERADREERIARIADGVAGVDRRREDERRLRRAQHRFEIAKGGAAFAP